MSETSHSNRNEQFEYVADLKSHFVVLLQLILSVDRKKKELVGNFKNSGRKWSKEYGHVLNHDIRSKAVGIANPYGIYDLTENYGFIVIGTSCDTAEFAGETIENWLVMYDLKRYKNLQKILILCDSEGSNDYRVRLWRYVLYCMLSCKYNISVTVCHYPSGASKWNPLDHRLFSFITINWAVVPLRSYETMLKCIRQMTNSKGLKVNAILNKKDYAKGAKVTNDPMKSISIREHSILHKWNYTIGPN